ncbi:MAG: carboxylesterase [Rhodocyclaceae bacterium]|nr:carboxylesterase [Rhodocyclaceae bacterium]MBX3666875.1 carboxylesterase [Rhodocyclaceae bacterium]
MTELLPGITVETAPDPKFAVIWLHGLGADGYDFEPIVPELRLPQELAVRFVFPHAPMMPVTCNYGYVMRAWYDIRNIDGLAREVDVDGIIASREAVRRLIEHENARGIACSNIVLAGFSQGGAMAYTTGLTHPETLAGIVALSAYVPAPELLEAEFAPANAATPLFAAHGSEDLVVPMQLGAAAVEQVARLRTPPQWHSYRMPHAVCPQEIADLGAWFKQRFQ